MSFSYVFGFWVINILYGKIFLGDSGAYLIGTLIGWSVLLYQITLTQFLLGRFF